MIKYLAQPHHGSSKIPVTFESKEKDACLIVYNCSTRIVKYIVVINYINAFSLAEVLALKLVLKSIGFSESIESYSGPQLTSKYWSTLCFHLRICYQISSTYHPQTGR
jgi:hypothetical protein